MPISYLFPNPSPEELGAPGGGGGGRAGGGGLWRRRLAGGGGRRPVGGDGRPRAAAAATASAAAVVAAVAVEYPDGAADEDRGGSGGRGERRRRCGRVNDENLCRQKSYFSDSVARRFEALDTTGIQNYTKKDTKIEKCLKEQKKSNFPCRTKYFL